MLHHAGPAHPDYQRLKNIEQHVRDGAGLARELLGFARGGKYEVKPANINELIRKGSAMFGGTRKEIALHGELQENVWTVAVDAGQIEQALLNIYINGGQAMPSGGDMFIKTENVVLDETTSNALPRGRYVRISITDTGIGMDEATVGKIFDPFFTTREASGGTGLGLASTYGIIRNHGGDIDVLSRPSEGTTFRIYLPATDARIEEAPPEESGDTCHHGEKTILLVDDEEMIRDVTGEMLEALGYRVLYARSGSEALETYRRHSDTIDMVIIDMVMPGMGGKETFAGLKGINSEVRALLASGYSIDGEAQTILDNGCRGFIQKPFSLAALSKKILEVIG
jgi:CheY-like chemotaxis protein